MSGKNDIKIKLFYWIDGNISWRTKDIAIIQNKSQNWEELRGTANEYIDRFRQHYHPDQKLQEFFDQCCLEQML